MTASADIAPDRPRSGPSKEGSELPCSELPSWEVFWTASDPLTANAPKVISISASEAEEEEDEDAPLPDTEPGLPEEEDWDDEDFDDDFDDDFEDELDQELERELAERFGGDDNAILEEEEIDDNFVDEDSEVEEPKEVEEDKEKE